MRLQIPLVSKQKAVLRGTEECGGLWNVWEDWRSPGNCKWSKKTVNQMQSAELLWSCPTPSRCTNSQGISERTLISSNELKGQGWVNCVILENYIKTIIEFWSSLRKLGEWDWFYRGGCSMTQRLWYISFQHCCQPKSGLSLPTKAEYKMWRQSWR